MLPSLEEIALIPDPPFLTPKLVNLFPPHMFSTLFLQAAALALDLRVSEFVSEFVCKRAL